MDQLRAKLKESVKFDAYTCFQSIDASSDGYLDRDDILKTFRKENASMIKEHEI